MIIYKETNKQQKIEELFFKITSDLGIDTIIHQYTKIKTISNNLIKTKYPCELTNDDEILYFFKKQNNYEELNKDEISLIETLKLLLSDKTKIKGTDKLISVIKTKYINYFSFKLFKTFSNDKETGISFSIKENIKDKTLQEYFIKNKKGIPDFILSNDNYKQFFLELSLLNNISIKNETIEIYLNKRIIKEIQSLLLEKGIKSIINKNILIISNNFSINRLFYMFNYLKLNNKDFKHFMKVIEPKILFSGENNIFTSSKIKHIEKINSFDYIEDKNIDSIYINCVNLLNN